MNAPHALDPLETALTRELARGEILRWKGHPAARLSISSFGVWIFAIPWTAFSLFWTGMATMAMDDKALGSAWGWVFPLFGLPFIVIGFGMLGAPFAPLFTARRTIFAITDRRLISIRSWRSLKVVSVPADSIGTIERKERRDGSGWVRVEVGRWKGSDGDLRTEHFLIGDVSQVLSVEMLVRQLADRHA